MSYVYFWEYIVKVDQMENFIKAYGDDGDWVKLFSDADGYIKTELLRDDNQINRFVTVDHWESAAAFEEFKKKNSSAYEEIDVRYSMFSIVENFLGGFEIVSGDKEN